MSTLFLTVTDREFFPGTLAAVNSLLLSMPDSQITIINGSDRKPQLTRAQNSFFNNSQIKLCSYLSLEKNERARHPWQLKAYGANSLSAPFKNLVGFDSDLLFCQSVKDVINASEQDGKWRGGTGIDRTYRNQYSVYGIQPGSKNRKYLSTSCYFCHLTQFNRKLLNNWAKMSSQALYGRQKIRIYPGFGDQGILNALLYARTNGKAVQLLPNQLWSQHFTFQKDKIDFKSGKFINHSAGGKEMRTFHTAATQNLWDKRMISSIEHSKNGLDWVLSYFLFCLFEGPLSADRPNHTIVKNLPHLLRCHHQYRHQIETIRSSFPPTS